jgi:sugar O-acyltransferase (sialic acid O-acetyltransferase NeuD family)
MGRVIIIGFTPNVVHRILESDGSDVQDALILFNRNQKDWLSQADIMGFKYQLLNDWEFIENDKLNLGVLRPGTKKIVMQDFLNIYPNGKAWFQNAIHPFSSVSKYSELGKGVFTEPGFVLSNHSKIGHFVSINRNCSIGHHTVIGDYCMINPGVNIGGETEIGEAVTLGMGVQVFDGVKIGENAVIGAGSLVTKDIPANVVAYGSPCKVIREI